MALGVTSNPTFAAGKTEKRNYTVPMTLMVSLYFGIGFITALNDILIPHFKDLFHLTNVKALMVQLCFFGAYFVMSLPSGSIVGKNWIQARDCGGVDSHGDRVVAISAGLSDYFLSAISVCVVCCGQRSGAVAGGNQSLRRGPGSAGDGCFEIESVRIP